MRAAVALAFITSVALVVSACVTATPDRGAIVADPSPSRQPTAPGASSPSTAPSPTPPPRTEGSPPTPPPRSQEPTIGYISLDGSQAFVRAVSAGVRAAAADADIELVECDAGWTLDGVRACADELGAAGVHGVISFQPFPSLAAQVCATTGEVPTIGIVYDQGPCQVSLFAIDQAESGRLAGDALGRFAAERWDCDVRAYLSLGSDEGDPIGAARMQGYRDGYRTHCELPEDTRSLSGAQFLVTARTQVAKQLESIKGGPILVAAVSDLAVLGAMEAAADAGRENQLWYSGQLADPEIRGEIACNEHYIASVAQFPERFGSVLVPALVDAMEGREVPARFDADLELVTAANVRELFPDTPACNE